MERTWWYVERSEKKGPVSLDDIRDLLAAGRVTTESLFWKIGMSRWMALADIEELQATVRSVPPDIPVTVVAPPVALPPSLPDQPAAASALVPPHDGTPPAVPQPSQNALTTPAGAWRRFFARLVDLYTLSIPLGLVIGYWGSSWSLAFGLWLQRPGSSVLLGLAIVPLALIVESAIFGLFGTTVGKALLCVWVLTAKLERPTFVEYLQRQVGVYFYGLAMGIPLVSLFTLARQSTRLKKGLPASYDEHRFAVDAAKLGYLRTAVAVVVCVSVFLTNAVLVQLDKQSTAQSYAPLTWTNPETGLVATLTPGWTSTTQKDDAGQDVLVFANAFNGSVLIFGYEDVGRDVSLTRYGQAWAKAVKDTMVVGMLSEGPPNSSGRIGAWGAGNLVGNEPHPLNVFMTMKKGRVWRVIAIGTTTKTLMSDEVNVALSSLLGTL